jgi:hypothetical protein
MKSPKNLYRFSRNALLVFSAASTMSANGTPRLSIPTERGFPGATAQVAVTLRYGSNDLRNVVALQADLALSGGDVSVGAFSAGPGLIGHVLRSAESGARSHRVLVYSLNNSTITNGTVVTVPCTVAANTYANIGITLSNVVLATAEGNAVPVQAVSGGIAITPVFVRSDGNVNGFLNVVPEHEYVIQGSTNLINWEDVATKSATSSLLEFIDLEAHSFPYRFYRARSTSPQAK